MNQRFKNLTAKISCSVMTTALSAAMISTAVSAKEIKNDSNTRLGTACIESPAVPLGDASAWSGSYVYFGTYGGDPIKFRVLAPSTTAYGGSTLFLDSDSTLFDMRFDDDSNKWEESELRKYLNDEFLKGGSFTDQEQAAIASGKASAHDLVVGTGAGQVASWTQHVYGHYVALNGDKIFVLDGEEASNIAYGYSNTDASCSDRVKGGSSAYWWLRSAYTYNSTDAGEVSNDGNLDFNLVYYDKGVAPALNINQSSIIFSSKISGDFNKVGAKYKLTIADEDLKIAVPAGQTVKAKGTTVTVPYVISGKDAGNATRASVLILDKAYGASDAQILYYDALGGTFSNSAAATGSFTLPSSLDISGWGRDYHVYILAEDINKDKETDYAGEPYELFASYQVTYKIVNGKWSDGTTADKTEIVEAGETPSDIPSGMTTSYGFDSGSWDKDPSAAKIDSITTFTYTFEPLPVYVVSFNSNGHGTAPGKQQIFKGEKVIEPAVNSIEGWIFDGWFVDKECKTAYDFNTAVTSDLELYAKWTEVVPTATPTPVATATPTSTPVSTLAAPTAATVPENTAAPTVDPGKTDAEAKNGDVVADEGSKASYLITSEGSVTYVSVQKNVTNVSVPAEVKIAGKKYKVTEIKANAFKNNKKLKKVTIGKNIRKIGKNAFYGCKNLKSITVKTSLLTKKNVGKNAFKGINAKAVVKVPKKKLKAYKPVFKAAGIKGKKQKITK